MSDKDIKFAVSAEDRFSRVFQNLKRDISGISDQASRLQDVASTASRAVGALSLGTVAGVGGLGLALKSLANDLDALNDASDAVGDSVENLSAVEAVARRNGESLGLVVTAATKLNKALAEANPESPVAQALRAIGLSAKELQGVPVTQQLQRIALALQGYDNNAERVAITTLFFGKATREVASFLNDYAAAGEISATVTAEQARQAEIFNKQLAALSTNAGDAGRSIASVLLPALNRYAEVVKFAQKDGGLTFGREIVSEVQTARLRVAVGVVEDLTEALRRNPGDAGLQQGLQRARQNADALLASATKANAELKALVAVDATRSTRPANEGGGSLRSRQLPSLVETTNTSTGAARVSEAQRYLEQLQRQIEQTERLTAVQQVLRDIERGRVDGLNPALQQRLLAEARNLDLLREQDKAIKSQQDGLDQLIDKATARSAELDRLLGNTPTGQRQDLERQVDLVLRFSRANPDNEAAQRQALEAVQALRKQFDQLDKDVSDVSKGVETPFTRVDEFARKTTDALVEMAATGQFSAKTLFDSFKRDLLREFIEDPVRDSMRNVVRSIKAELAKLDGANNPIAALLKLLSGLGGSGSSPLDGFFGGTGGSGDATEGFTSRALGGGVRAGQLVRWQENGREWFRPGQDGTVVTEAQMRGAGAPYSPVYNITLQGQDPQATARQLRAMLDERDARMVRSMRYGQLRGV